MTEKHRSNLSRRQFLKSSAAFTSTAALVTLPKPAHAYIQTVLAVVAAAIQVYNLFNPRGSASAALAGANLRILLAIQMQLSDVQSELQNIAVDINDILNSVRISQHVIDATIRQNDLIALSTSMADTRVIIAENIEGNGPRVNVDTYLEQLKDYYFEFSILRNGLLDIPGPEQPQRCLHIASAMLVEMGIIGFFAGFDSSSVKSDSALDFVSRNWRIELRTLTKKYSEYYQRMWNLDGTGEIQAALNNIRFSSDANSLLNSLEDGAVLFEKRYCQSIMDRRMSDVAIWLPQNDISHPVPSYFMTMRTADVNFYNAIDPTILPGTPIPHYDVPEIVESYVGRVGYRNPFAANRIVNEIVPGSPESRCDIMNLENQVLNSVDDRFERLREKRLYQLALMHIGEVLVEASKTTAEVLERLG